ncbi:MAG: disulfide reductase, partial [Candidatus Kariarchaeaceae archaeon]
MDEEIRIGVFICHCGVNIASIIDVEAVMEYSKTLDNVVMAESNLFSCSSPGQNSIIDGIKNENLNRVIVAACSPKMHENT